MLVQDDEQKSSVMMTNMSSSSKSSKSMLYNRVSVSTNQGKCCSRSGIAADPPAKIISHASSRSAVCSPRARQQNRISSFCCRHHLRSHLPPSKPKNRMYGALFAVRFTVGTTICLNVRKHASDDEDLMPGEDARPLFSADLPLRIQVSCAGTARRS